MTTVGSTMSSEELKALRNQMQKTIDQIDMLLAPAGQEENDSEVLVTRKGKKDGQGVGFLRNGTMVVIDGGESYIGQTIMFTPSGLFNTQSGKMMFGKVSS